MFDTIAPSAADPILAQFNNFFSDARKNKIDLGIGLYRDENGLTPVMRSVKKAEEQLLKQQDSKSYVSTRGNGGFLTHFEKLLLGEKLHTEFSGRVASVQTAGCTAALRVVFETIKKANPQANLWISDPSWPYHTPCALNAGLQVQNYKYYNHETGEVDFDSIIAATEMTNPGDAILIHAVCHNPTGADLTIEQWDNLAVICNEKQLVPLIDASYMGFAETIEIDLEPMRRLISMVPESIIAASCSKTFGVYRDRLGAALVITKDKKEKNNTLDLMLNIARSIYSMPPDHAAATLGLLMENQVLVDDWQVELAGMRQRIKDVRSGFAQALIDSGYDINGAKAIKNQKGVFSLLNIGVDKVAILRDEMALYLVGSGRINIAGMRLSQVEEVAKRICSVL